jgi:hypothetical protein
MIFLRTDPFPLRTRKDIKALKHTQFRYWAIVILTVVLGQQLNAATARSSSKFFGTYLNESSIAIEIDIVSRDSREGVTIPLEPGHIEKTSIPPGTTKLYLSSRDGQKRRMLWSGATPTPMSEPNYFDKKAQMFYFRVIAKKVVLVMPRDLTDGERMKIKWYNDVLRRDSERR